MGIVTPKGRLVCACVVALCAMLAAAMPAGTAHAQVCGDADGDGQVTDVDGVNALRAAAELSTTCTLAACDINADGVLNDTDGVLILRKAAGLSVNKNCIQTSDGPVDPRASLLVQHVQPFLEEPFGFVPQVASAQSEEIINCQNAGDGEVIITIDEDGTLVEFADCLFANVFFNGEIADGEDGFIVSLGTENQSTEETIDYEGESLAVTDTGSALRISGPILASPFFDTSTLEDAGDFTLDLFRLLVGPDGTLLGGMVTFDLTETELPGLSAIEMTFDGSSISVVTITDDNQGTKVFLYDLAGRRFL